MENKQILTTQEIAQYLKLNEKTVLKMAQSGELPGFKIANQWRFYLSTVDEYLQDKVVKSSEFDFGQLFRTAEIMPLSRFVDEDTIILDLVAMNQQEALQGFAQTAFAAGISTSVHKVLDQLLHREQMLSTAIGNGVAIPHPRNPSDELFKNPGIVIARSGKGVDFGAPDGRKVHLFFMTCAPDVIVHLRFLSKIAELLKVPNVIEAFMQAQSKSEIMRVLLEHDRIELKI